MCIRDRAEIVIYPVPQGIYYARHNDDYTVKVRQVGEKDWVCLLYTSLLNAVRFMNLVSILNSLVLPLQESCPYLPVQ